MSETISAPKPFVGSKEQKERNLRTHRFDGETMRCINCDSKMWHVAAQYPCGIEPPRVEMTLEEYLKLTK